MVSMPDWNVIAALIFGMFVLYFLSRLFYRPLKLIFRALLHIALGGVAIFLYNLVGTYWGLTVGLNVISSAIVGVMGLPGLAMLIGLQYILH